MFVDQLITERMINDGEYDIETMATNQDTVSVFDVIRAPYEMYYDRCWFTGVILAEGTYQGFKYVIVLGENGKVHYGDWYLVRKDEE